MSLKIILCPNVNLYYIKLEGVIDYYPNYSAKVTVRFIVEPEVLEGGGGGCGCGCAFCFGGCGVWGKFTEMAKYEIKDEWHLYDEWENYQFLCLPTTPHE